MLRVICRATSFVVLQHVYMHTPGVQSASRRYVHVRTGAELLAFDEDYVPESRYSSARPRRIG